MTQPRVWQTRCLTPLAWTNCAHALPTLRLRTSHSRRESRARSATRALTRPCGPPRQHALLANLMAWRVRLTGLSRALAARSSSPRPRPPHRPEQTPSSTWPPRTLPPLYSPVANVQGSDIEAGQRVRVRFEGRSRWFFGTVRAFNADGTYAIDYDDGDAEDAVLPAHVKLVTKSPKAATPKVAEPTGAPSDPAGSSASDATPSAPVRSLPPHRPPLRVVQARRAPTVLSGLPRPSGSALRGAAARRRATARRPRAPRSRVRRSRRRGCSRSSRRPSPRRPPRPRARPLTPSLARCARYRRSSCALCRPTSCARCCSRCSRC